GPEGVLDLPEVVGDGELAPVGQGPLAVGDDPLVGGGGGGGGGGLLLARPAVDGHPGQDDGRHPPHADEQPGTAGGGAPGGAQPLPFAVIQVVELVGHLAIPPSEASV